MEAADRPLAGPWSRRGRPATGLCAYQLQDSAQTLAEGIEEYHAAYPRRADAREMSPVGREFFRCHDAVHVVYGCGVTLNDEACVKIASIFGTTGGLGVLAGYRLPESMRIYRQLPLHDVLRAIACSVVVVPAALMRCRRQRSRWPWADFDRYLPAVLGDLRREFGIEVAHARRHAA